MDDDQLHYRIRLDRRRFEEAHLKYAMLMVQARYPTMATGPLPIATDISDTLEKFTPAFYEAFTHRYSGKLINQTWVVQMHTVQFNYVGLLTCFVYMDHKACCYIHVVDIWKVTIPPNEPEKPMSYCFVSWCTSGENSSVVDYRSHLYLCFLFLRAQVWLSRL